MLNDKLIALVNTVHITQSDATVITYYFISKLIKNRSCFHKLNTVNYYLRLVEIFHC